MSDFIQLRSPCCDDAQVHCCTYYSLYDVEHEQFDKGSPSESYYTCKECGNDHLEMDDVLDANEHQLPHAAYNSQYETIQFASIAQALEYWANSQDQVYRVMPSGNAFVIPTAEWLVEDFTSSNNLVTLGVKK